MIDLTKKEEKECKKEFKKHLEYLYPRRTTQQQLNREYWKTDLISLGTSLTIVGIGCTILSWFLIKAANNQ